MRIIALMVVIRGVHCARGQHVQSVYCAIPLEDPLVVALSWRPVSQAHKGVIVLLARPGTIVEV